MAAASALALSVACAKKNDSSDIPAPKPAPAPAPAPVPTPEVSGTPASTAASAVPSAAAPPTDEEIGKAMAAQGITGTITAEPNPIRVCDKSGLGETTLKWKAKGVNAIKVRVGSPDGSTLAFVGPEGKQKTGKWVTDGSMFYLQNGMDNAPGDYEHTIARVRLSITEKGCP